MREKEKTWYDDSKMSGGGHWVHNSVYRSQDAFRRKDEFVQSQVESPAVHSLSGRLNNKI